MTRFLCFFVSSVINLTPIIDDDDEDVGDDDGDDFYVFQFVYVCLTIRNEFSMLLLKHQMRFFPEGNGF